MRLRGRNSEYVPQLRQQRQVRRIEFVLLWTTATTAVGLVALAVGLTAWLITRKTIVERTVLNAAGLVLVYPSLTQDVNGIGLFGLAGLLQYRRRSDAAV